MHFAVDNLWGVPIRVGGLELPDDLVKAVHSGRWTAPAESQIYVEVFGEAPEQPDFYDLASIERQNRSWQALTVAATFGEAVAAGGVGIDPALSVVIGDLGVDMPIALDYRLDPGHPRVVYLRFDKVLRWVEVARNFGELLELLNPGEDGRARPQP